MKWIDQYQNYPDPMSGSKVMSGKPYLDNRWSNHDDQYLKNYLKLRWIDWYVDQDNWTKILNGLFNSVYPGSDRVYPCPGQDRTNFHLYKFILNFADG